MRVLTVTTSYPRHPDDWAGRFVRDLNAGLVALGHSVSTLAPAGPGLAAGEADPESGPVRRVPFSDSRTLDLFYGSGAETNARRLGPVRTARAFRDATRAFEAAIEEAAEHADLVLAHWVFPGAWWAVKVAKRTPIVGVLHGADARLLARPVAGRIVARRLRGRLRGLACVSQRAFDAVGSLLEVPRERTLVSPMGIDASTFGPSSSSIREQGLVVAAGRLVPTKGFDLLVRACADLEARLVIAGDGPERERLARDAAASGVTLEMPGVLGPRSLAELFRRAAVVAAPSRTTTAGLDEGVPLVVLEALACGAAVVGAATGGLPEVLPAHALAGEGGGGLTSVLRAALALPERFRDPGAAARFDRVNVARRLLTTFA